MVWEGKRNEQLDQIKKTLYDPNLTSETYSTLSTKTNVSSGDWWTCVIAVILSLLHQLKIYGCVTK
jgi:hypothetical protein